MRRGDEAARRRVTLRQRERRLTYQRLGRHDEHGELHQPVPDDLEAGDRGTERVALTQVARDDLARRGESAEAVGAGEQHGGVRQRGGVGRVEAFDQPGRGVGEFDDQAAPVGVERVVLDADTGPDSLCVDEPDPAVGCDEQHVGHGRARDDRTAGDAPRLAVGAGCDPVGEHHGGGSPGEQRVSLAAGHSGQCRRRHQAARPGGGREGPARLGRHRAGLDHAPSGASVFLGRQQGHQPELADLGDAGTALEELAGRRAEQFELALVQ